MSAFTSLLHNKNTFISILQNTNTFITVLHSYYKYKIFLI